MDGGAGMSAAHPKPQGALDRVRDLETGRFDAGRDVTPAERELLRHIADHADIVAETPRPDLIRYGTVVWLLVPLPRRLLEMLAEFEADEREADTDREPDVDREPDIDDEDDGDRELEDGGWSTWAPDWWPETFAASESTGMVVRRPRPKLQVFEAAD